MAAAQQLFLDKGVDATTISDIVAAAGVAKGTFYHYFQAKTDILLALRERFTQAFQQRIANAVGCSTPGCMAPPTTPSPAAAWIPSRWPANSPMPSCACSVPATEAGSAAEGFLQVAPVQPPFVVTVQDYGGQALAATRRVGLDFPIG